MTIQPAPPHSHRRRIRGALAFALALAAALACTRGALAQEGESQPPLCRFGVTLWEYVDVRDFDLGGLRASWYVDYYSPSTAHLAGLDYAPMIRLQQVGEDGYRLGKSWAQIDALLAANPGALLQVGNEPDRRIYQDDMAPAAYAAAYHDLYYYVKRHDPSAQVLAGNIVQPTPVRLQYLDLVLAAYRSRYGEEMPVDAWSIHGFILNERSCRVHSDCWGADIPPGVEAAQGQVIGVDETDRFDLFVAGIERFRRWMAERGYRDRPLYVTEFGILMPPDYGYPPARVNAFMTKAFNYLLSATDPAAGYAPDGNRLVQRFAWYAVIEPVFNGGLFVSQHPTAADQPPYAITPMGEHYRDYTAAVREEVAVSIVSAVFQPPIPPGATQPYTATLAVRVGNSGSLQEAAAVQVAVYDGPPAAPKEPLAPIQTARLAGCGDDAVLAFTWRSPPGGAESGFLSVVAAWPGGQVVSTVRSVAPNTAVYAPLLRVAKP